MNVVDIVIIVIILLAMVVGSSKGVIKETVNVIGTFLVLIFSFLLMGPLASVFYKFCPFFNLGLLNINLAALNILIYQLIAFALVFFVLNAILRMVLTLTNIIDTLMRCLIFIKPVSSFLGAIVGVFSGYVVSFIILLILSVPFSGNQTFHESKFATFILQKTPILASLTSGITNATSDIYELFTRVNSDSNNLQNSNQYNLEALDIMLKYDLITVENVEELQKQNKLGKLTNIDSITNKYRIE